MKSTIQLFLAFLLMLITSGVFAFNELPKKVVQQPKIVKQDSIKKTTAVDDSIKAVGKMKFILHKKNAHASYYANKFNGRKTASGSRFDNNKYTAAHRKFPFGTKLRITNEANNKSVIVEVTDRGPFTRGRDIDLTTKAFNAIASPGYRGSLKVTIEEIK